MGRESYVLKFLLTTLILFILFTVKAELEDGVKNNNIEIDGLNEQINALKNKNVILEDEVLKLKDNPHNWLNFVVTGYSANDITQGTTNITAAGFNLDLEKNKKLPIIAVDPEVIPLYSIVEIKGLGGFIALDTGEDIKGNRIDILFNTKEEALEFGKKMLKVRVICKIKVKLFIY